MTQKTIIAGLSILFYSTVLQNKGICTFEQAAYISIICFSFLALANTLFYEMLVKGTPKHLAAKVLFIAAIYISICALYSPLSIILILGMTANLYFVLMQGVMVLYPKQEENEKEPIMQHIRNMLVPIFSKGNTVSGLDSWEKFEKLKEDMSEVELLGVTETFIRNFEDIYSGYSKNGLPKQVAIDCLQNFSSDIEDVIELMSETRYTDDREVFQRLVSLSKQTITELK